MTASLLDFERLPNTPGVYLMKDSRDRILYIGKAIDLQKRVSQYFIPGRDEREMVPHLLSEIKIIDFIVVCSEKEALLLERRLIQEHHPKYNVCLKDDSSFYLFHLDPQEKWPKLRLIRAKDEVNSTALVWGPYSDSKSAREVLDLLHGIFPLRRCSDQEFVHRKTPCLYYQIKRCPAPCVALCSSKQYHIHVKSVIDFLNGKIRSVLQHLQAEMDHSAERLEFEHAAYLRDLYKKMQSWKTPPGGSVESFTDESVDLFGIVRRSSSLLITRSEYREGRLMHMDHFLLKEVLGNNEDILQSWVLQHYMDLSMRPTIKKVIFCLEEDKKLDALGDCLSETFGIPIEVILPKKEPFSSWARLLYLNSLSKLQTLKGGIPSIKLEDLQHYFGLDHIPKKIECVDHSHIQGHHSVSAVIVCEEGQLNKRQYRRYNWGLTKGNDLALLKSFMMRRYSNRKAWPDLILLDGGKLHWQAAHSCLLELSCPTIQLLAISKDQGKHTKGMVKEKLWGPKFDSFRYLEPMSPYSLFLQQLRDEAHRVALSSQRKQRVKSQTKGILDDIPGIGPKLKASILTGYGSINQFIEALKNGSERVKLPCLVKKILLQRFSVEEFCEDD